jgi:hypothetical protein
MEKIPPVVRAEELFYSTEAVFCINHSLEKGEPIPVVF